MSGAYFLIGDSRKELGKTLTIKIPRQEGSLQFFLELSQNKLVCTKNKKTADIV